MTITTQKLTKVICHFNASKHLYALNSFNQKASYAEQAAEFFKSTEEADSKQEEKLERIRNISGLSVTNYKKLHGVAPYMEPIDAHHRSLRWKRRQFGLYGMQSGIDAAMCFTTKEEMEDLQEYEKVAFDKSILEIRNIALQKLADEKEERKQREEQIIVNLQKCAIWKQEILDRVQKKEQIASKSKKERERLVEEVRRYFGYTIDTKDEKFQIMLEIKEREKRKSEKDAKKKQKEERFMSKLASLEVFSEKTSVTKEKQNQAKENNKNAKPNDE